MLLALLQLRMLLALLQLPLQSYSRFVKPNGLAGEEDGGGGGGINLQSK